MSNSLIRILIAMVLIAHGIGHILGLFPIFGWAKSDMWTGRSWLLGNVLGEPAAKGMGLAGLIVPQSSWRLLALALAIISFAGIVLYWGGLHVLSSKIGALVVDAATLIALLWARWPTPEIVSA